MSKGWSSKYYELPPNAKELQDLIEFKDMNFAIANVFKAAYRLGDKEGTDEAYDLHKILWFAQRELDRIENSKPQKLAPCNCGTIGPSHERGHWHAPNCPMVMSVNVHEQMRASRLKDD